MKELVTITSSYYNVANCRNNPDFLYIFGDNTLRIGKGGQAVIRDEPNSVGLCTKISIGEFMSDTHYNYNKGIIDNDIITIKNKVHYGSFKHLVFPKSGFGWGLADMQHKCPLTALYLCQRLIEEFDFNNLQDLQNGNR